MQLLPSGAFAILGLLITIVGLGIVAKRGIPKAYGLGLLMMAVFLVDFAGQVFRGEHAGGQLGFVPERFFAGDAWWSPLTSVFTHAPPPTGGFGSVFNLHIIGNLFILVTAGPALESRIGEKRFLLIFGAAAAAAVVAHVIIAYATAIASPDQLALGASGGIFGVLTAFAVRHPKEKLPVILFFIFWIPSFIVLLFYLGLNVYLMITSASGVAWWGHFAGFLVGLAFAYTLPHGPPAPGSRAALRSLPDPSKLEPLATTPATRRILERIRQFTPDAQTRDDPHYVEAWLDRFFDKATCPQGHPMKRSGMRATCGGGETSLEFGRV